jgi:hypothetical protein
MTQCPFCRRWAASDLLFAGTEGACIECYLDQAQLDHDVTLLFALKDFVPEASITRIAAAYCGADLSSQLQIVFSEVPG